MSSVTPPRAGRGRVRALAAAAALVALAEAVSGCSGDDSPQPDSKSGSSGAKDEASVQTVVTLQHLSNGLSQAKRARLKEGVAAAIDPWFDDAWLSDPGSDHTTAFAGFTQGAASDAEGRDVALMTNQPLAGQVDSTTATQRRVTLDVFATKGHARGATAHVVLDFTTTGTQAGAGAAGSYRVTGDLYLSKDRGVWKVFGYDVDQAVTR